jgi:hypothetical protein
MFRDSLIQKAWDLRRHAEGFPVEALLEAAAWLEEKYRKEPTKDLAVALVLHYLILAMRRAQTSSTAAKEYFSRALHWHEKANHMCTVHSHLRGLSSIN